MKRTFVALLLRGFSCCPVANDKAVLELRESGEDDYRFVLSETEKVQAL